MNLKCDAPLSTFAINCNLRHYGLGWFLYSCSVTLSKYHAKVGRCSLTLL